MASVWVSSTPAIMAHALLLALAALPLIIPMSTNLSIILHAALTVYAGSWRSVKATPSSDSMTKQEAFRFPIVGSCVLFSLFLAFKFLPKELVNAMLSAYLGALSIFVMAHASEPYLEKLLPSSLQSKKFALPRFKVPYLWDNTDPEHPSEASLSLVICCMVSSSFCLWYFVFKFWFANNILGIAFCLEGIEHLSLGSVQTGVILLVGLFFYDIFWVFCTPVMVSVAKNFDAPIKLLFPRAGMTEDGKRPFSMLGLGDIVIPGIFVAMMLRYDIERNFQTGYFQTVFVGYTGGLVATIVIMNYFQAAQPALLYIVPFVLLSLGGHALLRGEVKKVWNYEEAKPEEIKEESDAAAPEEAKKEQ
jgi:minor histocompatibility antigen H13